MHTRAPCTAQADLDPVAVPCVVRGVQMGYAMLECAMVALAPELQAVVDEVHAGLGGPGGS